MKVLNAPQPLRQIRHLFGRRPLILPFYRRESRPGSIPPRQVFAQLRTDLTGKDSHRGVTLSYTWLANQFGHFSLGFIPTILLVYCFGHRPQTGSTAVWAAAHVSLFWTLFEILNFLGPLLMERSRKAFAPAWRNIAFDTLTDILFFCLGASIAASLRSVSTEPCCVAIALGLLLLPISYYWYVTKMYQQRGGLPKQLRLGQWDGRLGPSDLETIRRFNAGGGGQHLLIVGDDAGRNSDLGIALANERAIRHHSCRYFSAVKLAALIGRTLSAASQDGGLLKTAATLVVDDFNAGGASEPEAFGPAVFAGMLRAHLAGPMNGSLLKSRSVIWILGEVTPVQQTAWIAMLLDIGVRRESVSVVHTHAARSSGQNVIVVREGYQMRQAFDVEALV